MKIRLVENKVNIIDELPGDNGNAYSASKYLYHAIKVTDENTIAKGGIFEEAVEWQPKDRERGGVIIFSTDVNAKKLDDRVVINWLKQKTKTIENRLTYTSKIDKIANKNELIGWTVGKYLDGRYKAKNGKTYGENSLSVEIIGVDTNKLLKIADELCNLFVQETVLVKDYSTGNIFFVDGK